MTNTSSHSQKAFLFWGVVCIIVIACMYFFSHMFLLLALSILISLILEPIIFYIEQHRIKRNIATFIVFLASGAVVYFIISLFIPQLITQLNALVEKFKTISLQQQIDQAETIIHRYFPFFSKGYLATKIEGLITSTVENILSQLTALVSSIFSVMAILFILPFLTFFIVKDRRKIMRGLLTVLPNRYFEMSYWILKQVSARMGIYVRGWLIDATFVGVACGVGFHIIGVPNAPLLGLIAGLGHLVPYFGPIIGGIPALTISVMQNGDLSSAPYLIILIISIYVIDNGFVQPYVLSKSTDLHPLVIILLIIAGNQLMGIPGMLFAVPIATVLKTAAVEIYYGLKNYKIARL